MRIGFGDYGRRRPSAGRSGRRTWRTAWALASAGALAAVGLLAAPQAQAAAFPPLDPHTYYIGDDGALWGYEGTGNGTFTEAVRLGPAELAEPGARLAAVRAQGYQPSVFFVGVDGAVYQQCPNASQPFRITSTGFAPSGAAIAAFDTGKGPAVAVSGIAPRDEPAGVAAGGVARRAPLGIREISNPCTPPPRLLLNNSTSYTGGDMAATGTGGPYQGVFFVDNNGSLRAQWYSAATSTPISVVLTQPETATPGGGIAVTSSDSGALTLFFTGRDGQLYTAHAAQAGGLTGAPRPNTTGPANVPDGAHLAAASGLDGIAVGYAASDGTFTVATLSPGGDWQDTVPLSDAGFVLAGSSAAVTSADDGVWDWYCGNEPRVPWRVHGPVPRPTWFEAGPPNAIPGTFFTAA